MSRFLPDSSTSKPIALAPSFLQTRGRNATEDAIRRVVCSVAFELMEAENAFRLLGPEMSYHNADPYLPQILNSFQRGMTLGDVFGFRAQQFDFDLCLEDSWTGYFICRRMAELATPNELLLIHLDDHADMMPTMLCASGSGLIDPSSEALFDPTSCDDWEAAIYSGAVNIGNYITPFFYSGCKVHVRHIRNADSESGTMRVSRQPRSYDLIPNKQFAAVGMSTSDCDGVVGTYVSGSDPGAVLKDVPRTWTILHIDLDYFINDFNGESLGATYVPDSVLQAIACEKMDRFFPALKRSNPTIDRIMIATSPGFCCSYHWKFLLSELEKRIRVFRNAQAAGLCSAPLP